MTAHRAPPALRVTWRLHPVEGWPGKILDPLAQQAHEVVMHAGIRIEPALVIEHLHSRDEPQALERPDDPAKQFIRFHVTTCRRRRSAAWQRPSRDVLDELRRQA